MEYEAIIGLEVHAQLLTKSKIFCSCSTEFGAPPNTHTCPVCLGMPGVLPVLNKKVVEYTLKTALALNCKISKRSVFARKNYFYPDLPKGYQISQYELPISEHGWLEIEVNGVKKRIGITRIHMEEDAGKLVHAGDFARSEASFVDFNRTGVPLIEIVSEPDLRSPEEAVEYVRTLRNILVYLSVCDGNMQEGSLRCDANVSVMPKGSTKFGTRTELKNMNSFRNIQRALAYEIERQIQIVERGEEVVQETRLWDEQSGRTYSMRGKEEAHDYRYFPDPDLIPIVIDDAWIEEIKRSLPELPAQKKQRFIEQYKIPEYDAGILTQDRELADYYEEAVAKGADPKWASNWIMSELLRELKEEEKGVKDCPVKPSQLAELYGLIAQDKITGKIAKSVFVNMYKTGKSALEIVREQGLEQLADESEIMKVIERVISENPKQVEQYLSGKEKVIGFFVGQVMKLTAGKANPQILNELLVKKLKELKG